MMYNGFLFHNLTWTNGLMWIVVLVGLLLLNEFSRRRRWAGVLCFVVLPVVLTVCVWPMTAGGGSSTGTWFHWVKVYSALAGCLGFMYIRYSKAAVRNRYWLLFPPAILSINILEACTRDFQVYSMALAHPQLVDGVVMMSGPWNIMNGMAGIINIITITGWMGIYVSRNKSQDMIWPDMLWWWIIAYDVWNFAYVYNCVSDHAFFAGAALLVAPTIAAFTLRKGAWLQHRAHTLAFWMMFTMSFPMFVDRWFPVPASHNPTAWFVVSLLSLVINMAVLVLEVYTVIRYRRNPLRQEVYVHSKAYKSVVADKESEAG